MSNRPIRRFVAPLLALSVTAGTLTAVAQTKKSSSSKSKTVAAKKDSSPYHRLPAYYGQLKLKPEQREEVYKIKDEYGPKIDKLEKELEELKEAQDEEIKDVLTRTQVTALNKLVAAASAKSKSSGKSTSSSRKK
ncbi:hypothetical protein [Fuerstiella marisgermanici]|uniref:LTXXQ motif family protein n=1 Tax=Fuerstiella marisgermanici TaxID=1891926 RepID=A0A1P8WLP8_9PLAN|nr:hypothetical protein [Fuerstiella marisgermanici]APZ94971.1 hypothetical protein Fuma_04623 [Fuerstiella marisgermanici]